MDAGHAHGQALGAQKRWMLRTEQASNTGRIIRSRTLRDAHLDAVP
jgi:hypothetical protein